MASRILVPLRNDNQVEDILSCIEFISRPGTEVVFLLRLREGWFPWWLEHTVTFHTGLEVSSNLQRAEAAMARQEQLAAADEKLASVRKRLALVNVSFVLEVYSGSLKSVVRRYSGDPSTTIILKGHKFRWFRHFWASLRRPSRRFNAVRVPMLLMRG